jgi:hypothetical protein
MLMEPFYLFLRYMALDEHLPPSDASNLPSERDDIACAMNKLDKVQKDQLIHFVDQRLAEGADDETLARVFNDGHTYRIWRTAEGPRQLLNLIREVAQGQQ